MSEDLETNFITNGYVVADVADMDAYGRIRDVMLREISEATGKEIASLEALEEIIPAANINRVRLHVYKALNDSEGFMDDYFAVFRPYIERLVGTELACQNRVNLSIQLPNDETSRLGLHTDTVSGQSEFEVVAWLPFTRAFETNSLFIHGVDDSQKMLASLPDYQTKGMDALAEDWKSTARFLSMEPGKCLIFSSTLMHGNVVNRTTVSRVSLNGRFKALFSPYNQIAHSEKKLGNFYRPFRVSPVTRLALRYEEPNAGF